MTCMFQSFEEKVLILNVSMKNVQFSLVNFEFLVRQKPGNERECCDVS